MTMIAKARRRIPWKAVKRVAGVAFVVLVVVLIFRALGGIDWAKVWQGLKGYDARTLLPAAGPSTSRRSVVTSGDSDVGTGAFLLVS